MQLAMTLADLSLLIKHNIRVVLVLAASAQLLLVTELLLLLLLYLLFPAKRTAV
jgi:hypothetical protein